MQILPSVHHFDTGPFNWYIIEEGGRLTLIDAGFPGHYHVFIKGLEQIGKSVNDLEAILLTHSHADHTGFASQLQNEHRIPVYVHEADREAISRPLNLPWFGLLSQAWRSYIRTMLKHAIWNGVFRSPTITGALTFRDGDRLDVPGRPQVIHTPGHTPGEVTFHIPDRKILFSGDTLVTRNLMTGQEGYPQVPHRLLNANNRQSHRSLSKLLELGEITMLPGHGKPWFGSINQAIELANREFPYEGESIDLNGGAQRSCRG